MKAEQPAKTNEVSLELHGDIDRWFFYALLVPIVLIPLNLALGLLRFLDHPSDSGLFSVLQYFDMGEELTFAAWFTTALLVLGAVVALAASQRAETAVARRGFRVLTVVMAYISLDEATELHERTTDPLRAGLDLGGILYWSWVIPAALAVVLVSVLLWRFVMTLPTAAKIPLVASGIIYVFSALVLELAEGYFFDRGGASATTDILSMIEEVGEMVAVLLFIRTTAAIAARGFGGLDNNRFPDWRSSLSRGRNV